MDKITTVGWFWLGILNFKRYGALKEQFGSLDEAWSALNPALLRALGCKKSGISDLMARKKECPSEELLERFSREQTSLVTIADEDYPEILRELPDPPVILSYCGDLGIFQTNCVSLVGARAMSSYGRQLTEEIVPPLVRSGITTVSGLAKGVDSYVARVTLDHGGKTAAVLGHGLHFKLSREDAELARRIVESGGVVMSEFPPDMIPQKHTFPIRNRIIAGLSQSTVVIQAGQKSGSLITARLALEYNREVYALPGSIFDPACQGCHELIAKGEAKLLGSSEELLEEMGLKGLDEQVELEFEDEVQRAIFNVLSKLPMRVSEIQEESELEISNINSALTELELAGVVKSDLDGCWVRV